MENLFSNLSAPQQRFVDHLEANPCYGKEKNLGQYGPKENALCHGHYIQFNRAKYSYIGLDLDYRGGFVSWMDEVVPAPTIAFLNLENGHANLFWELESPVLRRCELNNYCAREHPIKYFKAVTEGYRDLLDGDSGYTMTSTKNPFSSRWRVEWYDNKYSLEYLAEFVTMKSSTDFSCGNIDEKDGYAGRNEELFTVARKKAYHWAFSMDSDSFSEAVCSFCRDYNREYISEHWPDKGPLPKNEAETIARNIVNWVNKKKDSGGFKQRLKDHGVMELPPIDQGLNNKVKKQITSCNQARGAAYTHRQRKRKTAQKIVDAIKTILSENRVVTKKEVCKLSGVGERTLNNYKEFLKIRI